MARIFTDGAELSDGFPPNISHPVYPVGYSLSSNFGDALNPFLYLWITERPCGHAYFHESPKIVACGSTAHTALPGDIVWGTGANPELELQSDESTRILAVRGPLTAELFYEHGHENITEIYGDPALLLSNLYPRQDRKTREYMVVPHYSDKSIMERYNHPIIDVMQPVERTIDEITQCSFIVSSALHGIVCAEAYGIPAVWVEFSDNVAGHGFKFRDYYLGTNRLYPEPLDLRGGWTSKTLNEIKAIVKEWEPPSVDKESLIDTCPFSWNITDYRKWKMTPPKWTKRNELIASLCPDNSRVFEFGAGAQDLRPRLIRKGCTYTPSDLYQRTPDTVVCDLNTPEFPDLSMYSTVIVSGVLEYIYHIGNFLHKVSGCKNIRTFIFSYNYLPDENMRNQNGYVCDLRYETLVSMAEQLFGGVRRAIRLNDTEIVTILVR